MSNVNSKYFIYTTPIDKDEITEIKMCIKTIEVKLDKILLLLETKIEKNCNKMGEHIEFIETVYSNVKKPLEYVCDKINSISYLTYEN